MKPRLWLAILGLLAVPVPALGGNPELEASIRGLRDGVADPAICSGALCPRVLPVLDRALAAFPAQRPALALIYASSGLLLLERYKLVAGGLEPAIDALLLRARERVLESRSESETAIGRLCSGVRPVSRRGLLAPERYLTTAANQVASGQSAMALRWLGSALTSYESAMRLAGVLATRCRPRPCAAGLPGGFTPGDPANPSLELVPPDRGTKVDHTAESLVDGEQLRGRIEFLSLSSYRVNSVYDAARDPIRVQSSVTLGTCRDGAGWHRHAFLIESAFGRHQASGGTQRAALILRAAPPMAIFSTLTVTLPPMASRLRVGDRLREENLLITGRESPGGAVRVLCTLEHSVLSVETRTVPAGTFETAKVESSGSCGGGPQRRVIHWVASEIGEIASESYDDTGALIGESRAICFESPETAGRCVPF